MNVKVETKSLREQCAKWRTFYRISAPVLATIFGVNYQRLYRLEQGHTKFDYELYLMYKEFFSKPIEDIIIAVRSVECG